MWWWQVALPTNNGLTPQEVLFCAEYVKDNNATRAYEVAFPFGRSAQAKAKKRKMKPMSITVGASKLMALPKIKSHIAALMSANMENALAVQEESGSLLQRVLQEISAIAFFDIRQFVIRDARGRPTFDMDKILADPIACKALSLEVGTTGDGEGGVIDVYKLKKYGKLEALDKLLKYAMIAEGKMPGTGDTNIGQQTIVNVSFPIPGSQRIATQSIDAEAVEADDS